MQRERITKDKKVNFYYTNEQYSRQLVYLKHIDYYSHN